MNSFVLIKVTGKNISLFIRKLLINNITYDKLKKINHKEIYIKISYDNYLKLIKFKTIYKIEVIKLYGKVKYKSIIKKNKSHIISIILSLILLYIMSTTCFKINVVHNNKKLRSLVLDELKVNGIGKYKLIPSYNKRVKIINKIIKENKNEIEWMEIERRGSILLVKLTERKINKKEEVCENRHIIAKKSGIIKKISASHGDIVKGVNDYVQKGDIIISGNIIKDETIKKSLCAKGVVYAETWYTVSVSYPLYYEEINYLNEIKNNYIITIFDKKISLKKNYASYYLENKKDLLKEKIFPFNLSVVKQRKTKTIKQKLSYDKAVELASKLAYNKLKKKLNDDEKIISKKTLNFSSNNSKIEVDVFFKVYENITDYSKIDLTDIKTPE